MTDLYRQTALDLFAEGLRAGRPQRLRVNGSSMLPALRPGDWLTVEPVSLESLRQGDLVVVRRPTDLVTHRLIRTGTRGWQTKGDALRRPDPPLEGWALLGRAVGYERGGKTVDLRLPRWQAANRLLGRLGGLEEAVFSLADHLSTRLGGTTALRLGSGASRLVTLPLGLFRWILVWLVGG